MAKFQTVSNYLKKRLVIGTIIIWGLGITSIAAVLFDYFATRHSILLVVVGLLVGVCVINLVLLYFVLPVLHGIDVLELWIKDGANAGILQPIPQSPYLKLIEPIFQACNALQTQLKLRGSRRIQFVERLAHDMRSSLASIQGYAEVLVDYHVGVEGASLQTYGRIIANQTYRLVKIVEDAETATCIAENRLSLEFEPIRLNALLDALIAEASKQNAREIVYQDDMGDCMVLGDSYRLREMISKIIENALVSTTSYVSIHTQIEEAQTGSWVKINIEDHGNPLSNAEINTIFNPFEAPKSHKTSPVFRSSLSFYIIKGIVESHNGKLSVQSLPGHGTTYTILLPVQGVKV